MYHLLTILALIHPTPSTLSTSHDPSAPHDTCTRQCLHGQPPHRLYQTLTTTGPMAHILKSVLIIVSSASRDLYFHSVTFHQRTTRTGKSLLSIARIICFSFYNLALQASSLSLPPRLPFFDMRSCTHMLGGGLGIIKLII